MPRSDTLRSEIARLEATEARLSRDLAQQEGVAAKARAAAAKKRDEAARTKSETTRRTAIRSAEAHDKKLVAAEKKVADVRRKLAANANAKVAKQRSLASAERSEQQVADRDAQRRRRGELAHAREVARVARPTVRYIPVREPQPEPLRVAYLTANAAADLRLDKEVSEVQRAVRGAKYRDVMSIHVRPAATPGDLLDALNDLRPHIVHFSGHGSADGVVFDNGDLGNPLDHEVEFGVLAQALAATSTPPSVLVLNACDTLAGAEVLLPAVPVVVAMANSVDDTAAIVFARQFYAAIASAQPVGKALEQAKAGMRFAALTDADLPDVVMRDDVDVETLVLVRPPGSPQPYWQA